MIQTKYHGEIDETSSTTILFENGIPGFPDHKQFFLLPLEDNEAFEVLQSKDDFELAFIVIDPFFIEPAYEIKLDDSTIDLLAITSEKQVQLRTIVSLRDPFSSSTVNLQAPIVVNTDTGKAKQMIRNDDRYSMRASLTGEAKS